MGAVRQELLLELHVVLDDPVDHDVDAVLGVVVRVGVLLGHAAVRGPARVADAGRRRRGEHGDAAVARVLRRRPRPSAPTGCRRRARTSSAAARPGSRCRRSHTRGIRASRGRRGGSPAPTAVRRSRRCRTWPCLLPTESRARRICARRTSLRCVRARFAGLRSRPAFYPSCACTSATRRAQTASASSAVGASTITRTSGSVPLGRSSTRPRPSSAADSRSTAAWTSVGLLERAAVAHAHVDERLRQLLHRVAVGQVGAAERLEREQRGGDAVAGGHEVAVDDVAGLLAAERPVALAQRLEHVAVADGGDRDLDAVLGHRRVEAVVGHHRHGDAVARQAAGVAQVDARRARSARRRRRRRRCGRRRACGRRRRRTRSRRRRRRPASPACRRPRCVEPQLWLMLRPSGSWAMHADVGAEAAEDLRRGAERRAVGAVEQDPAAGEVEVGEALLQRAQVVLERAVERAHAARMLRDERRLLERGLDLGLGRRRDSL